MYLRVRTRELAGAQRFIVDNKMKFFISLSVALLLCRESSSFKTGPPIEICSDFLRPGKAGHGTETQEGNGGFKLIVPRNMAIDLSRGFNYKAFTSYRLMINSTMEDASFRGFVLQATNTGDNPGTQILGEFRNVAQNSIAPTESQAPNQQLLNCLDGMMAEGSATVTHSNPNYMNFTSQMFTWKAPSTDGFVEFRYSIVEIKSIFYFNILASNDTDNYILVNKDGTIYNPPTTATPDDGSSPDGGSSPDDGGSIEPELAVLDDAINLINKFGNSTNQHILRFPDSCDRVECIMYINIIRKENKKDYLFIYMEGMATAWIAVGFSESNDMFSADVLACNLNPSSNMIEALDTWNEASPVRNNVLDNDQNDVILIAGSYLDGKIRCQIQRKIAGISEDQDLNLDGSYYRLYGVNSQPPRPGSLVSHVGNPSPNVSNTAENLINSLTMFNTIETVGGSAFDHSFCLLVLLVLALVAVIIKL